jgi:hypothetical protein
MIHPAIRRDEGVGEIPLPEELKGVLPGAMALKLQLVQRSLCVARKPLAASHYPSLMIQGRCLLAIAALRGVLE